MTEPTKEQREMLIAWSKNVRENAVAWLRCSDHLHELFKRGDADPMSDDYKAAAMEERFAASNLETILNCHELIDRLDTIDALAAEAHKAALEADARVAEMREACARIAGTYDYERHTDPVIAGIAACKIERAIRALPNPSGDRFIRLLEAARDILRHGGIADAAPEDVDEEDKELERALRRAISAFPQPEEQP